MPLSFLSLARGASSRRSGYRAEGWNPDSRRLAVAERLPSMAWIPTSRPG